MDTKQVKSSEKRLPPAAGKGRMRGSVNKTTGPDEQGTEVKIPVADSPATRNPRSIEWVKETNEESEEKAHARLMASPTANAAVTIYHFHPMQKDCDITALLHEVGKHALDVRDGDMRRPEAMLVTQAHTLDVLFNSLAQKAAEQMRGGYLGAADGLLRLAMKAQSQCRTTIEAIAEIKTPKSATFIKQANIAQQQQVNNGAAEPGGQTSRAHEKNITPNPSNELLTESPHATLDAGGAGASSLLNPKLEAMEALDRAKH
jgi:hypothetical protein